MVAAFHCKASHSWSQLGREVCEATRPLAQVMAFEDKVTLGNLPHGEVDKNGVWRHPEGRRMERVVRDFLSGFGTVCPPVLVDQSKRRAIVRMTDAIALLSDGTFVTSPYHSILQKLPGQRRRSPAVRAARALRIRRAQPPRVPSSTHPAAPGPASGLKPSCYCIPTRNPSRPDGILTAASFPRGGSSLRPPPHPAGLHMLDMTLHEAPRTFLAAHLNAFAQPDSTPAHHHASWFAGVAETRLPVPLRPPAPARSCQKRHARRSCPLSTGGRTRRVRLVRGERRDVSA